jgi:hypothetical protein
MFIFGPDGLTGPTGPTGLFSEFGLTGPTGSVGLPADAQTPIQIAIRSYTGTALANAVTMSNATPTMIWSGAVPAQAQGRTCMLNMYIDISNTVAFPVAASFDFGIYVDGVGQGFGPTKTVRYVQRLSNVLAMGTNIMTPLSPITIPIAFSPTAANITIGLLNSSVALTTSAVVGVDARISTV